MAEYKTLTKLSWDIMNMLEFDDWNDSFEIRDQLIAELLGLDENVPEHNRIECKHYKELMKYIRALKKGDLK